MSRFRSDDFVQTGFSFTGTVVETCFTAWCYYGKERKFANRKQGLFMYLAIQPNADEKWKNSDKLQEKWMTCGNIQSNQPSVDNESPVFIMPMDEYKLLSHDEQMAEDEKQTGPYSLGGGLPKGSNVDIFFENAVAAGLDEDRLDSDHLGEIWVGVNCHWVTIDQPDRNWGKGKESQKFGKTTDPKKKPTVLVCDRVNSYDVDVTNLSTANAAPTGVEYHDDLAKIVVNLAKDGPIELDDVILYLTKNQRNVEVIPNKEQFNGMMANCEDDWMADREEWKYENETITLV